ncbi:MAG TPA: MFS transporter [Candidatus Baltobacteraceae bacterium]|nr:MFS transporter [Candidatus Baltobacteraceae bacterium]
MSTPAAARRVRFHYAFVVVATAFVMLIAAAGVRSSPTVLIQPLEHDLGWSPALVSAAIALNIGLFGFVGPFAAGIFERFGLRRTIAGALSLLAIAAAASTFMTQAWQFFLFWGLMVGLGTGTVGLVAGATIVNRWFETNRGTAMGILTASNATGQLVFLPLFAWLVTGPGWRTEVLFVAAVCAVLAPAAFVLLREHPSDMNLPAFGASEVVAPSRPTGNPFVNALSALREGARTRDFWLLAGSFFICGASTNGLIGTHLVPACGDHGIPEVQAAGLLAAMGVFDLVGTTASGWLSDRYSSRRLLFWYYGLRGLSLIFLPAAFGFATLGLPLFAVFYGLDWIATVPPTLKLATNAFGSARAPMMFGWIFTSHQIGAATAAFVAGVVRTVSNSYDAAFIASGTLCMAAAVLVLFIGRSAPLRIAPSAPASAAT